MQTTYDVTNLDYELVSTDDEQILEIDKVLAEV